MNNQEMKNLVEEPESSSAKELPSAERAERLRNQAARLVGISLEGESECGHVCYNAVLDMLEKNAVQYLPPSKFVSRKSELSNDKSSREIVLDGASTLKVRDKRPDLSCDTSSELLLVQALHRRALALDLMNAVTFSVSQRYNSFLIGHLQTPPQPGYRKLNVHQILQADKQAWLRLAELATAGLKRNAAGQLPLDVLFQNLQVDPRVMFYLLPLPESSGGHAVVAAESTKRVASEGDQPWKRPKGKGRGKSKFGPSKGTPEALKDKVTYTKSGKPICWAYNLPGGCASAIQAGQSCSKGLHVCAEPKCGKPHSMQHHATS